MGTEPKRLTRPLLYLMKKLFYLKFHEGLWYIVKFAHRNAATKDNDIIALQAVIDLQLGYGHVVGDMKHICRYIKLLQGRFYHIAVGTSYLIGRRRFINSNQFI